MPQLSQSRALLKRLSQVKLLLIRLGDLEVAHRTETKTGTIVAVTTDVGQEVLAETAGQDRDPRDGTKIDGRGGLEKTGEETNRNADVILTASLQSRATSMRNLKTSCD